MFYYCRFVYIHGLIRIVITNWLDPREVLVNRPIEERLVQHALQSLAVCKKLPWSWTHLD